MPNPTTVNSSTEVAPSSAMESWSDTVSDDNSQGLPWLACFGYDAVGSSIDLKETFPTTTLRRCQIAANLKDYCDTDDNPTSDVDPADWSNSTVGITTPAPIFTGNERTPYINKVGFNVRVLRSQSGTAPNITVSAIISITPYVELINIYGPNWPNDLRVTVAGKVTVKTTIDGTPFSPSPTYDFDTTYIPIQKYVDVATPGDWTTSGYSNLRPGTSYSPSPAPSRNNCTDLSLKVEVESFEITKVVLHDGTTAYDYTKTLTNASPVYSGTYPYPYSVFSSATDPEQSAWFGFAVHDPRQNLNSGDWKHLTPSVSDYAASGDDHPSNTFSLTGTNPYYGAPNAENSTHGGGGDTDKPTVGPDLETGITDPANCNLSTAYIRNAPMESPWELGFIHRGAKWQTINLKTYDSAKAITSITIGSNKYLAGGGLYSAETLISWTR